MAKFKFEYVVRPNYTVVQVVTEEGIIGSFNVKADDLDLWYNVENFIRDEQAKEDEIIPRINSEA